MSTTYGIYKYNKYNPDVPLQKSDMDEFECSLCDKVWRGTMTCFECHPYMIPFLLPRPEFLIHNEYSGEIPDYLKDCPPVKNVRKSVEEIISDMRTMKYYSR
jgi:hypothetical protein